MMAPNDYVGAIMEICQQKRGNFIDMQYISDNRVTIVYEIPLAEIVYDFFDKLKSSTKGYASFDYELMGYKASDLVKMDILLNGEAVDALSLIVHRDFAYKRGKAIVESLGKIIPRQQFEIPIQACIGGKAIARADIKAVRMPEVPKDDIIKMYEILIQNSGDVFKIGAVGFSMFERAWTLRGMENFLTDMILEPDFANYLLDTICEYNLKIIDIGLQFDIDCFHFGDDWGQQSGLIMGPELWRKFIKPRMTRMYERAKSKGKFVSQHSCGDIHEIFPDLIDMGLDVYQTFQPEIYDIYSVKKEYGSQLSFWGGISTQALLPFATPEEVREKATEIMHVMGKNGGYIAAPTHAVPGDVPPENIEMLIKVFQNQHICL
jgi:hypothetical protein